MLKLLNAGGEAGLNTPEGNNCDIGSLENSSESNSANNLNLNFTNTANSMVNTEESIYESLWETGQPYPRENETQNSRKEETRFSQAESEVRALSRIVLNYVQAEEESFYENTGVATEAVTLGVGESKTVNKQRGTICSQSRTRNFRLSLAYQYIWVENGDL